MSYLPPLQKISQEVIATAIAVVLVAYVVAKVPALKKIVRDYQAD